MENPPFFDHYFLLRYPSARDRDSMGSAQFPFTILYFFIFIFYFFKCSFLPYILLLGQGHLQTGEGIDNNRVTCISQSIVSLRYSFFLTPFPARYSFGGWDGWMQGLVDFDLNIRFCFIFIFSFHHFFPFLFSLYFLLLLLLLQLLLFLSLLFFSPDSLTFVLFYHYFYLLP